MPRPVMTSPARNRLITSTPLRSCSCVSPASLGGLPPSQMGRSRVTGFDVDQAGPLASGLVGSLVQRWPAGAPVAMSSAKEQAATASGREDAVAARIVDIVRELAVELNPRRRRTLTLDLDSDLDRDVGLDSLGRAELLLRLDRQFKVRLPDSLIGDARCLRDLLAGVLAASPTVPPPVL